MDLTKKTGAGASRSPNRDGSGKRTRKAPGKVSKRRSRRSASPPATTHTPEPARKSETLVNKLKRGETPDQGMAAMMVEGVAANTMTSLCFSMVFGELNLTDLMAALSNKVQQAQNGDLSGLEGLLAAQAITLNAMFTQLANKSAKASLMDQMDRFTRLALKAQGQCRTTVETLALIKLGRRTVFVRQANIAHGPQQVNNGLAPEGSRARTGNQESEKIKLLEESSERLDLGASITTGEGHQALASVGAFDRPAVD